MGWRWSLQKWRWQPWTTPLGSADPHTTVHRFAHLLKWVWLSKRWCCCTKRFSGNVLKTLRFQKITSSNILASSVNLQWQKKIQEESQHLKDTTSPDGVCHWIECLWTKGFWVRFPVRAHAWLAGQAPSRGRRRGNHTLLFLSFSFSLPFPLSKINR